MEMKLFTKSKKIECNIEKMNADFEFVRRIVETTVNPAQFPALENLVNNFANKWKPVYIHKIYNCEVERKFLEYENAVNYLQLKLQYEYKKVV